MSNVFHWDVTVTSENGRKLKSISSRDHRTKPYPTLALAKDAMVEAVLDLMESGFEVDSMRVKAVT